MKTNQVALVCFWTGTAVFSATHNVMIEKTTGGEYKYNVYNMYNDRDTVYPIDKFDKAFTGGNIIVGYIVG